jgi:hypothetical protein
VQALKERRLERRLRRETGSDGLVLARFGAHEPFVPSIVSVARTSGVDGMVLSSVGLGYTVAVDGETAVVTTRFPVNRRAHVTSPPVSVTVSSTLALASLEIPEGRGDLYSHEKELAREAQLSPWETVSVSFDGRPVEAQARTYDRHTAILLDPLPDGVVVDVYTCGWTAPWDLVLWRMG